jgi:hypothetical protein
MLASHTHGRPCLFVWLVADGWCWFVLREKYCWLVAGGWFVLRKKYGWLVADKPNEHGDIRLRIGGAPIQGSSGVMGTSVGV